MDSDALEEIIDATLGALNEADGTAEASWYALPPTATPTKLVFFLMADTAARERGLTD